MRFCDIPGLSDIKANLIESVTNNHVAHAQLFLATKGSPNLPIALAFATYLNCTNKSETDACGTCASCAKMAKFIHPDLHFAFPVSSTKNTAAKDALSINFLKDWRSFLIENPYGSITDWSVHFGGENKQPNISKEESRQMIKALSLKSFEAEYKVMLIWLPEYMHLSSANAILKILEEPPEKTVFLLVSNDIEKLLPTIISRTQIFKIRKFSDEEIKVILSEKYGIESSKAQQLTRLTDGDINQTVRMLSEVEDDSHEIFKNWMRFCYTKDFPKMVEGSENFQKMSKEAQKGLLQYGLEMMRETLIHGSKAEKLTRLNEDDQGFIENFSKIMDHDKSSALIEQLNKSYFHLERNANAKITFLDLSLIISKVLRN